MGGNTELAIITGSINSDTYIATTDKYFISTMYAFYPERSVIQEDDAPCYKSKKTKSHRFKQKITISDWPPESPDLNPIERLRAIIKQDLETINPKNKTELKASVKKIWDNIDHSTIRSLIESIPTALKNALLLIAIQLSIKFASNVLNWVLYVIFCKNYNFKFIAFLNVILNFNVVYHKYLFCKHQIVL